MDIMDSFIIDSGLYIDDDNVFYFTLPLGCRWSDNRGKMIVEEDKVEEDQQIPSDVRTIREMVKMANTVCPVIQWTSDCPGEHQDGKMPLELKIWIAKEEEMRQQIMFEFYRKPMASRALMLARSAMPSRVKRATLTQEALRILKNCSPGVPWSRRAEFLTNFCVRMKISGYKERYRETVITSALAAWQKMQEEDRSGVRPLYRSNTWKKEERQKQKVKKRAGWFKQLGGKRSDFPLFCPMSPGGRLAERWRRVVEEVRQSSGGLVRATVVEKPGIPISSLLVDSMPGELDDCGKPDCNPCVGGTTKRLSCHRSTRGGMVYHGQCTTCKEQGMGDGDPVLSYYHGRTSRCLYTRQKEHLAGLVAKKEDNALWKHQELHHPDRECSFVFEAERFFNEASSHQS